MDALHPAFDCINCPAWLPWACIVHGGRSSGTPAARRARADGCARSIAMELRANRRAWPGRGPQGWRHQAGRSVACDHVVLPRGERIAATETRRLGRALASKTAWACSPEPHLMLRHRRLW